jgi:hypothetical protein
MLYDDQLAADLAEHAATVYRHPDEYALWTIDRGFDGAFIIPRGSSQVGIAYSAERIVVAARGSSELGDWGENALTIPWAWRDVFPVGRSHLGFHIQARRVRKEFCSSITALLRRCPSAEIYVTGHSLGGALSVYLARFLSLAGAEAKAVYTFESPRVFTKAGARWFDGRYGDRTFRVVITRQGVPDIVTRVPPSAWGWQHVGQPVVIRDGIRYESEEAWELARATHPVRPLAQWRILSTLLTSVRAHLADLMVRDLRAIRAPGRHNSAH